MTWTLAVAENGLFFALRRAFVVISFVIRPTNWKIIQWACAKLWTLSSANDFHTFASGHTAISVCFSVCATYGYSVLFTSTPLGGSTRSWLFVRFLSFLGLLPNLFALLPAGVVAFDSRKRVAVCLAYSPWFGAVTNWTWALAFTLNGLATAFCQTLVHVGFAVFSTNFFLFLLQASITGLLLSTRTLALAFNLLA